MSSIQKVRTYVYDTPATYNQFDGGINTNLSNEALETNELRDGLNCHYVNQSLVNRRGEKIIKKLILPINTRPQGDFVFSAANKDYIISVRNGHIFYGDFSNSNLEITMNLLLIDIPTIKERDDCENYLIDIREETEIDLTQDTEGFIYKYYAGNNEDLTYVPEEDEYRRTLIIQNTKRVQGVPVDDYFIMATGLRVLKITEEFDEETNDYFLYARVLDAYAPNSWEFQNIGVNNLSPFPNYYLDETQEVPMTSIGQIKTYPKEIDKDVSEVKVEAMLNCLKGYTKHDLYYKWEARIGANSEWSVLLYWNADKNGGTSSKGKSTFTIPASKLKALNGGKTVEVGQELFVRCTVTSDFQLSYDVQTKKYNKDVDD